MIALFLNWWIQQLLAIVPARLRRADTRAEILCVDASTPGQAKLLWQRGRREDALGVFATDAAGWRALAAALPRTRPATVRLRMPPSAILVQQVAFPLAAERELDRVLRYEMDRITPFSADELHWGWTVERRDRARGRVHLRLSLVLKTAAAPLLDGLRGAGLTPAEIEAAGPDGASPRIGLAAPSGRAAWRRQRLAALFATGALAVAAAVIPFVTQALDSRAAERQIAQLRPGAEQAAALRQRIAGQAAGSDVIAAERARVGDMLGALATLTDVLPDDTVLTDLTVRARMATLVGRSAAAAHLIEALAADPAARNPAFAAPVTRDEPLHTEGFTIRVEIAP